MRILYVLTSLGIGGAEKQITAIAARIAAQGHSVAFLVLTHSREEWPVKLPVLRLNMLKSPIGVGQGLRFARNFVTLFRPDIVHSHTFPANIFTRLLCVGFRVDGRAPAVVNTIHNVQEGGMHRMLIYAITSGLVDRVTAVSQAASDRFIRLHAVPRRKMTVLTNGIDTAEFSPDRARRKRLRSQWKLQGKFLWLAVGRVTAAKDYPNLLRAFAMLQASEPSAELWIAGEGDPPGGTSSSSIQWLGLRRDIADLLEAADGFVLSSAWEGMPLAIGEAMSMAKPIVATNVGGVSELVGTKGTLVEAQDSNALAAAMLHVMHENEMERARRSLAARDHIVKYHSLDVRVAEWLAFYGSLRDEKSHD